MVAAGARVGSLAVVSRGEWVGTLGPLLVLVEGERIDIGVG